jgi:hypothetical protein
MPTQRIKGQEVTILIVQDSQLQDTLKDIQDAEITVQSEVIEKGYLGEKGNRFDDIFNGIKGKLTLHLHTQDYFTFVQSVINRQQRAVPDTVFNISMVLAFPNGQTPSILCQDCVFGEFPITAGARNDYVQTTIDFSCQSYNVQFA